MSKKTRFIVHVDMDAFFASVEQHDNPEYRGKPVIVGADPKKGKGRGVVAACSYEARKYGIHSAMPISIAYRKCPHAVYLRGNMHRYAEISDRILGILEQFTPDIEPVSIDEAFLDITGSHHLFGTPEETCIMIKKTVKKETGLTASIGLAPNKMTAKIASDIKKPDGLVIVDDSSLLPFLHPLPVNRIWGIGEKSMKVLIRMGIKTIGDLAAYDPEKVVEMFGKNGMHVWELANGIDPREVESDETVKSISNEHTFPEDTDDMEDIKDILMYLSEKVSRRMRKNGFKCRTITLKIRFRDFKTYTRAVTIAEPSNFATILYENCINHLKDFDLQRKAVRLLGVKASNLIDTFWDTSLFTKDPGRSGKKENIHRALDKIKDKYGEGSIGFRGH